MTTDETARSRELSRRGVLATGVAAGVGTVAVATAAEARTLPDVPGARARGTWEGELGANAFGPVERRSPTEIYIGAALFGRAGVWKLSTTPGATGGRAADAGQDGSPGGWIRVQRGSQPAFPRLAQQVAAPPAGSTVRLRGWVRTEEVSAGHGAYLSVELQDSRGRRVDFAQSIGITGTHGWTRLSVVATVPQGATRLAIQLLLNGVGAAFFDGISLEQLHLTAPAHAGSVRVAVGDRAEVTGLLGMGLQDNGHAWASYGEMTSTQRTAVARRLAWMRPRWLRTFVDRVWWERGPGYYRFDGAEIQGVADAVAAYATVGAQTNLVMWRPTDWDEDETGRLADCFVALLEWLSDQGLPVDALTFINEPDREYSGSSQEYLAILLGLRERLHAAGWSSVQIVGGDVAAAPPFYGAAVADPDASADMLSFHTYVAHEESLHVPLHRAEEFVDVARQAGDDRAIMVWESNATSRTGREAFSPGQARDGALTVARFPSMLTWAAYALQALSAGVHGICYWETMDSYYQGNRDFLMEFGLWSSTDSDIQIRHSYYLFGLLSRYIQPGADLVGITRSHRAALVTAAVRNPDGSRVTYLLNPWPAATTAELSLPGYERTVREHRWTFAAGKLGLSRQQPELRGDSVSLTSERGLRCVVPPESLVVLVSEPPGSNLAPASTVAR